MNNFAIVLLVLSLFYQVQGQYQWNYFPSPIQQPIIYQASSDFYNPFAQLQQFYQSSPVIYHQQQNSPIEQRATNPSPQVKSVAPLQSNNIENGNTIEQFTPESFRGFGYHTSLNDGATSTVVFLSGPQASTTSSRSSITVASDILDPQNQQNIQEALKKASDERKAKSIVPEMHGLDRIRAFLENPTLLNDGINFFSAPGFPASTAPLNLARSLNINNNTKVPANDEQVPAESVIHQSRINNITNDNKEQISTSTSTTIVPSTTSSSLEVTTLTDTAVNEPITDPSESSNDSTTTSNQPETTTLS